MRGRFRQGGSTEAEELTLTPLLDMFTIILIFLIVSFEAEDHGFEPNKKIKLPESSARSVFKPAVDLAITADKLLIDKQEVMTLQDGDFPQEYYDKERIDPLVDVLEKVRAKLNGETVSGIEDITVPDTDEAILLVQADKKLDYKPLYLVLRSATIAGFTKYRLVVMKE